MKLRHQTFLLLSVPLLFEVIFICTLMQALYNAEQEFLAEAQNREISMCVNSIMRDMLLAVTQLGQRYLVKKTDFQVSHIGSLLDDILEQRKTLKKLIAHDSAKKKQFEEFNGALDTQLVTFDEFREMMNGQHDLEALQVLRKLNSLLSTVNESGAEIIQSYEKRGEKRKLAVVLSRERVRTIIIFGSAFNLLMVAGLGWWTMRFSLSRLQTLMRNNERLAKHEQLLEPIKGTDEFAELDRTFHKTAKALDEAKRKEREFVSMISHDIRSPLGGLKTTLELFETGRFGELNEKGKTALAKADIAIGRILEITEGLLELDKLQSGQFILNKSVILLSDIIKEAVGLVQSQAEKYKLELLTELRDDAEIEVDEPLILRVLMNLLTNAIKFSKPNSQVHILALNEGKYIQVKIIDHGRGIPAEKLESIFERYAQVELADSREREGTGLGLPICRAIVLAHGGTMGVESRLESGSTFWFRVPLAAHPAENEPVRSGSSQNA